MANTKRSREKEAFWRRVVRRQERSGLSVREFCRQEGVSEPSFYGWRREIARRDEAAAEAPAGLVELQVVEAMTGAGGRIEIETPSGCKIRADGDVDPDRLALVLDTVLRMEREAAAC